MEFSQILLKRCGDLTLDVGWERVGRHYRIPHSALQPPSSSSIDLEVENMHRFHSYSILLTDRFEGYVSQRRRHSSPIACLEEVALDTGDIFITHSFPYHFLDGKAVSLRSVQLRGWWLDFDLIRTGHLQGLEVAYSGGSHVRPLGIRDWIFLVQACPQLRKLGMSLGYTFSMDDDPPPPADHHSSLHRLTELNLNASPQFVEAFVSQFSLPSLRIVSLAVPYKTVLSSVSLTRSRAILSGMIQRSLQPLLDLLPQTRMQISQDQSRYLCIGFTPACVDWTPSTESSTGYEVPFPWVKPSFSPSDWMEFRIKEGGLKLRELLLGCSAALPHITDIRCSFPTLDESDGLEIVKEILTSFMGSGNQPTLIRGCV